jgi:hydrogenase expression/formation protein HypC
MELTVCLGITGRVVELLPGYDGQLALVDVSGETRKVNVGMLPQESFEPGDWVIIHLGFVVERTDEAGAREAMAGLELLRSGSTDGADPDLWGPR